VTVPKSSRGDSTVEPYVGNLKVNVRGCDWKIQLIFRGNVFISVSSIYLKGLRLDF
jgi:hypothetical protein